MPFKYVPQPKTAAAEEPESALGKAFRIYNTPIIELLGQREKTAKLAQPGLKESADLDNVVEKTAKKVLGKKITSFLPTTKAKAKGFVAGATESVTPALVAQAASFGTGTPATAANLAIASEGAHTALDNKRSVIERLLGGVALVGGGAGALAGMKTAAAAKAVKPKAPTFEVEDFPGHTIKTITGTAKEAPTVAPVTPAEVPTPRVPYGATPVAPSKSAVAVEKAAAKLKAAEEARDAKNLKAVEDWAQNKAKLRAIETAKEGRVPTEPSISEGITAKTPEGGRASLSQRFVTPKPPKGEGVEVSDDVADALGLPGAKKAPAPQMAPSLERDVISMKRYTNKQEANAIAKATGGEVHQDGPRRYSIRFKEEVPAEPEIITPTPTMKFDIPAKTEPRITTLPKEPAVTVPKGPTVVGYGKQWSVSGHPELGEFDDFGKATKALQSLETATPEEAVQTMQELAKATDQPAPQIAPIKFPTAKLPGKAEPIPEQTDLFTQPTSVADEVSVARAKKAAGKEFKEAQQKLFKETGQKLKQEATLSPAAVAMEEATLPKTVVPQGGAIPVRLMSKADVLGEAYAKTQAAEKAGQIPKKSPFYALDKRGRPITPARMQGAELTATKAKKAVPSKVDVAPGPKVLTSDDLVKMTPDQQMEELTKLVNDFKTKGPRGGSTLSAFGAGQLENMIKIAADNPRFTRAMTTIAGAGIGAGTSEDPVTGALVGGAIGFGAPTLLNAINKARAGSVTPEGKQEIAEKFKENLDTFAWMLPDFQRASLLSKPLPLIMNSIVGPWGSIVMHGLEDAVRLDPRGIRLLKLALNPKNFGKGYVEAIPVAAEKIGEAAERTEGLLGKTGPEWYKTIMRYPGIAMTAGDEAAREIAKLAGYTDDEARIMTLTSEPYTSGGAAISKFKKGATNRITGSRSWLIDMSLPFYRTNMNQLEQGMERFPGLGLWMAKYAKKQKLSEHWQQLLAQQVIGGGTGVVGYMIGEETPPEDAKYVLKFLNNFGGQYGAIISAGFVMGQARQRGLSDWKALTGELAQGMPMPSTQPITDTMQNIGAALGVEGAEYKMPSGFVPGILDPNDPLTGLLVGAVVPKSEQAPSKAGPRPGTAPTSRFKYVPQPKPKK